MIDSVLKQWIADYSGVNTVVQVPFKGDRQDGESISFQLLSFEHSDFDDSDRTSLDETFVRNEFKNEASLLISIHSYGLKAYESLNKLSLSRNHWEARNLLNSVEITLNRSNGLNNLTAFEKTKHRHHWQSDFEFNITIRNIIDVHKINQWVLTGKWSDGSENEFLISLNNEFLVSNDDEFLVSNDGNPNIQSTIHYPIG